LSYPANRQTNKDRNITSLMLLVTHPIMLKNFINIRTQLFELSC